MKNLDNPDGDYADDKYTEETLARLARLKDQAKKSNSSPPKEEKS